MALALELLLHLLEAAPGRLRDAPRKDYQCDQPTGDAEGDDLCIVRDRRPASASWMNPVEGRQGSIGTPRSDGKGAALASLDLVDHLTHSDPHRRVGAFRLDADRQFAALEPQV